MSTIQHRLMVDRRRVLQGAVLAAAAERVEECFGVRLEPEIRFLGEF